jgi:Acyl-ACP thioesterase.
MRFMTSDFDRFNVKSEEYVEIYQQKVLPQHIDMSHHMNNIEYVKLALNVFSASDLELCIPAALEIHYLGESKEGQTMRVFRANHERSNLHANPRRNRPPRIRNEITHDVGPASSRYPSSRST